MVTIKTLWRPADFCASLQNDCISLLGKVEQQSIGRTRKEKDKIDKILGWTLCRMEASLRYGVHPAEIRIGFHEKGKPFFPDFPDFKFNITHGGNIIAVAFCDGHEVGIDVENADRSVNLMIAERYFAPSEVDFLQKTPTQQRPRAFLRLWTVKEAYLKMIGTGLSRPLNSFEIQYDSDKITIYENQILQDCTVFQDETDPKHIITVCVKSGENNFLFNRQNMKSIINFVEKNKRAN
ncbi:MAG: 4'-phosphopantetheinyl transferase superfamily protein [Bacteroidales bacterium]|nr:4'-phosphopantetheinyl transferase superfamily protein [Bacteroidales bacterium]